MSDPENKRQVVITGTGPVSAIGIGREAFSEELREGRSGLAGISRFAVEGNSRQAGEIRDFTAADYLETEKAYLDRSSELAFAAMSLALEDASLDAHTLDPKRTGLVMGSAFGSMDTVNTFFADFLSKGPRFVKPFIFPHTYANTAISLLAMEYALSGFHLNFASGAVSAAQAIVAGCDRIRRGEATTIFAGGYEALSKTVFDGYNGLDRLSPANGAREICAPFDVGRNGFILGEGAGMLVLEEKNHALARGARILGELTGTGMTGDSRICETDSTGTGIIRAMQLAMAGSLSGESYPDVVWAAANGSPMEDRAEARALMTFLGEKQNSVPVTSIKPMIGETLGAGGVLQVIAALAAMATGSIPPTLNLVRPEDGVKLDLVRETPRQQKTQRALSNSIDSGGGIVSLLVEAP